MFAPPPEHRTGRPAPLERDATGPLDPRAHPMLVKFGIVRDVARDATVMDGGATPPRVIELISGTLRFVVTTAGGRRHVPAFLHPGDTASSRWLQDDAWSIEAVTPATMLQWSARALADLAARHPETAVPWLAATERALAALLVQGRAATYQTAAARLACFLLELAARNGTRAADAGPITLDLVMRRTDIADHLAVSAETVSRELAHMRERDLLVLAGPRHLVLRDPSALARIAEEDGTTAPRAPPPD